jgi:hypothetical protein
MAMESAASDLPTKHKIRIFAQAVVMERRKIPKMEAQQLPSGLTVQAQNWYDEHECQQLAVNYNNLYIKESHLDDLLAQLCQAVKKSMRDKGLIT